MPYRNEEFINGEIYHIVIRGIDDNLIFKDRDDYYRGIFSIYEFNTIEPVEIRERRRIRLQLKRFSLQQASGGPSSAEATEGIIDKREKLVEILAFCFMPNHLHLLLRQIKDGGVTKFMSKLGTGYGGYFNRKYNRKGHVFQNRFLAVHIKDDDQLKTVFVYIHTNPISLIEPGWKEKGIEDPEAVIKFLENYKWSSYPDYIGKKNFPSVTDRDFILEIMERTESCKNLVEDWVRYKGEIREFTNLALE
jgi:putative transposase